jgi:hypothetical protein
VGSALIVDDIAGNARLSERLLAPDGHIVGTSRIRGIGGRLHRAALPVASAAAELRRDVARGWRRADLVSTFLGQVER